ncbi:MAG: hypothetical protein O3A13_03325 [Proteobacteria bacterium]|nr:hypothetical protein [Pseudomonadota bacterium]MDA0992646.1 hypothetical protein [Pseudomonadota bacterium]
MEKSKEGRYSDCSVMSEALLSEAHQFGYKFMSNFMKQAALQPIACAEGKRQ